MLWRNTKPSKSGRSAGVEVAALPRTVEGHSDGNISHRNTRNQGTAPQIPRAGRVPAEGTLSAKASG